MEADGGTLFLDEIGDMEVGLQTRLLRVLQEREFEMVGSTETHKVDVRVLSATHRNLTQAVAEGQFLRGFVLPPQRGHHRGAAAAPAQGRYPFVLPLLYRSPKRPLRQTDTRGQQGGPRVPRSLRLAGQCARNGERHHARHSPRQGTRNRGGGPADDYRRKRRRSR